jgi:hypothetical protein
MRLSDMVKKLEDMAISATKVVVADGKAACDAIKANHAKAKKPVVEEPKVEPQANDEVKV